MVAVNLLNTMLDNLMSFFKAGSDISNKYTGLPSFADSFDGNHLYDGYLPDTEVSVDVNDYTFYEKKLNQAFIVVNNFIESRAFMFYVYTTIVLFSGLTILR